MERLSKLVELPNGTPSHDTFGRLFSMLDAKQLQECFMGWVRSVSEVTKDPHPAHRRQGQNSVI